MQKKIATVCANAHEGIHQIDQIASRASLTAHLVAPEERRGLGSGRGSRAVFTNHIPNHAVVVPGIVPRAHGQRRAQAERPADPAAPATHPTETISSDGFQRGGGGV